MSAARAKRLLGRVRHAARPTGPLAMLALASACVTTRAGEGLTWLDLHTDPPCVRAQGSQPRLIGPRTAAPLNSPLHCDRRPMFDLRTFRSQGAGDSVFEAGFGEADITPPAGYSTAGYGPEAKVAVGYRNPLYARALVVQGSNGELLALAVVDLVGVSAILQREVAVKVHDLTGGRIGADRVVLSATHTHLGPGHYFSGWATNMFGGSIGGFDPGLVEHLADSVAHAITRAYQTMRRARAAWTIADVWGHTRNRAVASHKRNSTLVDFPFSDPPSALDEPHRLVNPRWTLLRVDTLTQAGGWSLAGTYSMFAIHGTGIPSEADLYDADLHGELVRKLGARVGGTHLFANGTEGDVSPDWPPASRCPLPAYGDEPRPTGPRAVPPRVDWQPVSPESRRRCLDAARDYVDSLTDALAQTGESMIRSLGNGLGATFPVQRAARSLDLQGAWAREHGACAEPRAGVALPGGAPDGYSRFYDWHVLGLVPLGTGSPHPVVALRAADCHAPKIQFLGPLQGQVVGKTGFPRVVDLSVFRLGDMLIATVPGEMTTRAGQRVLAALNAARPAGVGDRNVAVLGLANEYINYITTPEEYGAQSYEGASTLYGPATATVLTAALREMAQRLALSGSYDELTDIPVQPGAVIRIWPSPR